VCLDQYCSEVVKNEMALRREVVRPVCVTLNIKTGDGAGLLARQAARDIVAITKQARAEAPLGLKQREI